ncbi:MAG: NPCBM/NEW2 domain-containing protein, partial [Bacteroidota bacterium]|nr:NPCBM/NEW2 domain-containing protein [Bacteroidota bacterium]
MKKTGKFIAILLVILFAAPIEMNGTGLNMNNLKVPEYKTIIRQTRQRIIPTKTIWLSSLDLTKMNQGIGKPVLDKNADLKPLSIAKQIFKKGVGTRVNSSLWIDLGGASNRFVASVGVDDDTINRAKVTIHNFKIVGDGKKLWESGPMNYGDPAKKVDVNIEGVKTLVLFVFNVGSRASQVQLDWADAKFIVQGREPVTINPPKEEYV